MQSLTDLVEIMHRLRRECPWDKEQTLETLRSYLLEEAYECLGAINEYIADPSKLDYLVEELGDVLLQVLFQSELLSETTGRPMMEEILQRLKTKLIFRHPHVFGDVKVSSADAAYSQWEALKAKEKSSSAADGSPEPFIKDLGPGLTALQSAFKLGQKSQKIQFDWTTAKEVRGQLDLELRELQAAATLKEQEDELGDVLFSIVQLGRHLGLDPEVALAGANAKFINRVRKMQELSGASKEAFSTLAASDKENLWMRAKADLRSAKPR